MLILLFEAVLFFALLATAVALLVVAMMYEVSDEGAQVGISTHSNGPSKVHNNDALPAEPSPIPASSSSILF